MLCTLAAASADFIETCDSVQSRCAKYDGIRPGCKPACEREFPLCIEACGGLGNHTDTGGCETAVIRFDATELAQCEPRICEEGGKGIFLPFIATEYTWPNGLRIALYGIGLLWFFAGVAIVAVGPAIALAAAGGAKTRRG